MVFKIILSALLTLFILGTVIVIIMDTGDSGRKIAWLLVIAILPVVGFIIYLCLGLNLRHHWIFERYHKRFLDAWDEGKTDALVQQLFGEEGHSRIREEYRPLATLLAHDCRLGVSSCDELEIITEGHRKYELLLEDLRQAKESIHMEYFHFGADRGSKVIRDLLVQKAKEGVKVRFINENFANFPIPSRYYDQMKKAGVEVVRFTDPRHHIVDLITRLNYRNHRKIVVIDGKIGYTGGMNINDHYFFQWRDTHLRLTGPAVAALQFIFLDSWLTSGGAPDRPLVHYFPSEVHEKPSGIPTQIIADEPSGTLPVIQMGYVWALQNARQYFWIQTPYFVPPEPVLDALKSAAAAGLDVRVMLPSHVDTPLMRSANRSFYQECLLAGVRIYERSGEFIHSKTFVSDDYLSCVGTANLDYRSFQINYEDNAYFYDESTALRCRDIFLQDLELCREVTLEDVERHPWFRIFFQKLIRLFAPLL